MPNHFRNKANEADSAREENENACNKIQTEGT